MKSYLPFIIKTVAVEKVHRDRIVAIHLWGEKRLGVALKGGGAWEREKGGGEWRRKGGGKRTIASMFS